MDHILSIVLFTPLAGMLILMLLPASNPRLIKLWANIAALVGFLVSLPLVFQFDRTKQWAVRGTGRMDSQHRRFLSPGHRWAGHAVGDADHRDRVHRHPIQLERHREPAEGILLLLPAAADRHARRVHVARPPAVLRLLGDRAGAHVLHHRHLGRPAAGLRGDQVHDLYADRLGADAARHPDFVLRSTTRNSRPILSNCPTCCAPA
jgi:hypothetical protein